MKAWIYLSPHFDDVALSCGGLVWQQAQAGDPVGIWTICGGDVPEGPLSPFAHSLHDRWQTGREAARQRREEDIAACQWLGADYRHFLLADCIYRRYPGDEEDRAGFFPYASEESLFGPLHPVETGLVAQLGEQLARAFPSEAEILCPLALGGHVDHRLTRLAAENLQRSLWYYADYPYVLNDKGHPENLTQSGWKGVKFDLSEGGMAAWERSVAAHASQISTFWPDLGAICQALRDYRLQMQGVILWRPPKKDLSELALTKESC